MLSSREKCRRGRGFRRHSCQDACREGCVCTCTTGKGTQGAATSRLLTPGRSASERSTPEPYGWRQSYGKGLESAPQSREIGKPSKNCQVCDWHVNKLYSVHIYHCMRSVARSLDACLRDSVACLHAALMQLGSMTLRGGREPAFKATHKFIDMYGLACIHRISDVWLALAVYIPVVAPCLTESSVEDPKGD